MLKSVKNVVKVVVAKVKKHKLVVATVVAGVCALSLVSC